ncbi:MAG: cytochrome c [Terriglobales bacterium]
MGRALFNVLLLVALVALVIGNWVLRANTAQTNLEVLPDMAHSARYNAYAANPNFTGGATLQTPVAGTIPRGDMPLHYTATPQDALRAGDELTNPFAHDNQRALQRGAFVFANYCAVCHGGEGAGNGPVAQRGYPPPPSLTAERALKMKDGQMFHILTYGQNNMPSYASQLSRDDRWNVIVHVRALQAKAAQAATTKAAAKTVPGVKP